MIKFIDHFFEQKINIYIFAYSAIVFIFLPFLVYFQVESHYIVYPLIFAGIAVNIGLFFFWVRMFYVSYWTSKSLDINNIHLIDKEYFTLKAFAREVKAPVRASYHILEMLVVTRRLQKHYVSEKRLYQAKEFLPEGSSYHIMYKKI